VKQDSWPVTSRREKRAEGIYARNETRAQVCAMESKPSWFRRGEPMLLGGKGTTDGQYVVPGIDKLVKQRGTESA
jgi:hypothetical protein